jgi:hypothetical protein
MASVEEDFRRTMGFNWPEGSISYQPAELAKNEVHDAFVKAGHSAEVPQSTSDGTISVRDLFAEMRGWSGGAQERTFVPPGFSNEASEAMKTRRAAEPPPQTSVRVVDAEGYESDPYMPMIRTKHAW